MRECSLIIVHCTATPEGRQVTPQDIYDWHMKPPPHGRGWSRPGYRFLIDLDGIVHRLSPSDDDEYIESFEVTNGVAGFNSTSVHIVYAGGLGRDLHSKNTLTPVQERVLHSVISELMNIYPTAKVAGHNQFNKHKACPSFDVTDWLLKYHVPKDRLYAAT